MAPTTRGKALREATATRAEPNHTLASDKLIESTIRHRHENTLRTSTDAAKTEYSPTPPRYIIDLSLPPERRYLEVCTAFQREISNLVPLFDEVVGGMLLHRVPLKWLHLACWMLLRGVYDPEEHRELKGISKATGVTMYLLVCFNVLLDLFMGCSSGGAAVRDGESGSKMLHFRTLDWGMPSLRKVVIQLDFVTETGGPIVGSSLTYAGYVGVLTGVRKDFSLSLNFRPNRNDRGESHADRKYFWHLLMVLLGRRRSISSELRRFLLPGRESVKQEALRETPWKVQSYSDIVQQVGGKRGSGQRLKSTACYLCFSNGNETTIFEKDYTTAVVRVSQDFIVITNNDLSSETQDGSSTVADSPYLGAVAEILSEAKDRRQCAVHNYSNMRIRKAKRLGVDLDSSTRMKRVLEERDIIELVQKYPTTNEETHFACVLDAKEGKVTWCRRWENRITAEWIREHMSETW